MISYVPAPLNATVSFTAQIVHVDSHNNGAVPWTRFVGVMRNVTPTGGGVPVVTCTGVAVHITGQSSWDRLVADDETDMSAAASAWS